MNSILIMLAALMMDHHVAAEGSSTLEAFPACDSEIFCRGPLLDAAQRAFIYNDSKSFVDMKLNDQPAVILERFSQLNATHGGNLNDDQVKQFVEENFSPPGSEFVDWNPTDWIEKPTFISRVKDTKLRAWAEDLNKLWKELGRKITDDVSSNSSLYSLTHVKNPVIVPGGRFREFYYWDTYWVIKGLLLCEMNRTVKGIIENFLHLVDTVGFVPNGGRIYYQRRSQPPFLIPMADAYFRETQDAEFLRASLPKLEKEYNFWMQNRSVEVEGYRLNIYASEVNQPRPESYREDSDDIKHLPPMERMSLMRHITSAAESGWDFSSRWAGIDYDPQTKVTLQLKTSDIVPVDLNSILAWNERILAAFHRELGNQVEASEYEKKYEMRAEAIEAMLWNEEDGTYYDYQISTKSQNRKYFASNLNPLWTKCFPSTVTTTAREERMFQYLQKENVLTYPGGIPTSLTDSGEQWDFPNAWPPIVHMMIEGMSDCENSTIKSEAFNQAQKWINGNYKAYLKAEAMFEKYDVTATDGVAGSGGEYDVQVGFGWTNGVILSFLDKYPDNVTVEEAPTTPQSTMTTSSAQSPSHQLNLILAVLLLISLLFII